MSGIRVVKPIDVVDAPDLTISEYDMPTALRPLVSFTAAQRAQIADTTRDRRLLVSFVGALNGPGPKIWWRHRQAARSWRGQPGVLLNSSTHGKGAEAYSQVLVDSTFFYAPGGGGAHSYRLAEGLAAGAIPVLVAGMLLPFEPEVSWEACAVHISESELPSAPARLRRMSTVEVRQRREACRALSRETIGEGLSDEAPFRFALKLWARRVMSC